MNHLIRKWYNTSIKNKSILLLGSMLAVMWLLVALSLIQLRTFTTQANGIMSDYITINSFLDAFSTENLWLESYIRPSLDATTNYRTAIEETDSRLQPLAAEQPGSAQEVRALKHAIGNAMEYYRAYQNEFLHTPKDHPQLIDQYLSLRTQSAYIDSYVRQLLNNRMVNGNKQYQKAETRNIAIMNTLVGYMFVASLLLALILLIFSISILRPLTDLGRAAADIGAGRYDAPPLQIRGLDELGTTAQTFNLMQTQIRNTIHALERESEMEKHLRAQEMETVRMQQTLLDARFALLQSQINPHFLFNTLSTIAALAHEEDAPLSEDLIIRLSNFFRYSLENEEKIVPLSKELLLLRDYIELQETRYGERIQMEIQDTPGCEWAMIPKFTLQPLVENAILHGLRACSGDGRIRVRIHHERDTLVICVTDNGCGFDAKKLPASPKHRSIGLMNITERMELVGGKLKVFSMIGFGTCAKITIPKPKEIAT